MEAPETSRHPSVSETESRNPQSLWPPDVAATLTSERCWIIRRCTQRWIGHSLVYEDFPTTAGLMTREDVQRELDRVDREFPDEFCAHRISKHCAEPRCVGHMHLRDKLSAAAQGSQPDIVLPERALTQADGVAADSPSPRCRECGNLRRSLPQHQPGCRYAGQNCPGCMYATDAHLASCPIAGQFKLPEDTCCEGVDMPGVGSVHSPSCQVKRPVLRASEAYLPTKGGTQESTATTQQATLEGWPENGQPRVSRPAGERGFAGREGLFARLLFAARDLAVSRTVEPFGLHGGFFLECAGAIYSLGSKHQATCRVGRVADLVEQICASMPNLDLKAQLRASIELVDRQNGGAQ